MKNFILVVAVLLATINISAQNGKVGIGNTDPKATLDITGEATTDTTADGLIVPRLTGNQLEAKNNIYLADQTAALVYVTAPATAPSGKTINVKTVGYYYFDGNIWQKVINGSQYDGNGKIDFGDIFPNTPSTVLNQTGNISSIDMVTTTLGVVKAVKVVFTTPMPDTNYIVSLTGGTSSVNPADNQFNDIGGVVYYCSHKTVNSFIIVAQEILPDTQKTVVDFTFKY